MPAAILRHVRPELMDDPSLPRRRHELALRGLERLNVLSRSAASLLPALRRSAAGRREVRVLDVATGSGDVAVSLARLGARCGINVSLGLCDISGTALEIATARARRAGIDAETFRIDATREGFPVGAGGRYDLAVCSLFLHHLDDGACVRVLASMARVARVVAVNDMRRCRRGVALAWIASRALTRSDVVHTDAVISARAAWTMDELGAMAERAGLCRAVVRPVFPCRMVLTWEGA